jgi:hypothetical protein
MKMTILLAVYCALASTAAHALPGDFVKSPMMVTQRGGFLKKWHGSKQEVRYDAHNEKCFLSSTKWTGSTVHAYGKSGPDWDNVTDVNNQPLPLSRCTSQIVSLEIEDSFSKNHGEYITRDACIANTMNDEDANVKYVWTIKDGTSICTDWDIKHGYQDAVLGTSDCVVNGIETAYHDNISRNLCDLKHNSALSDEVKTRILKIESEVYARVQQSN